LWREGENRSEGVVDGLVTEMVDARSLSVDASEVPMTSRGLPLYVALLEQTDKRTAPQPCCTDVPAEGQRAPRRHRVRKLRNVIATTLTVFVKLLRRPVGGTVVVLVPRERISHEVGTVVVAEEDLPRAS
jgi:hypothetical protein